MLISSGLLILQNISILSAFKIQGNHSVIKYKYTAEILDYGLINCFEEGLLTSNGEIATCETSGVLLLKDILYFANDKAIPFRSPVFKIHYNGILVKDSFQYLMHNELIHAMKFEEITATEDGKFIIATTAFDRHKEDHSWDEFNKIVYWEPANEDSARVLTPVVHNGIKSSVGLRKFFSNTLANDSFPEGMPYFKIEGLCCLPGNRMIFGIRETGRKYDDFTYSITMIAVDYKINNKTIELDSNFKIIFEYHLPVSSGLYQPLGLSGLAYDKFNKRIYLLTSYEHQGTNKFVGGYLWILPLKHLKNNKAPLLVCQKNKEPLFFSHKPDGITVIDKDRIFIVCDDDKLTGEDNINKFSRKLNQFAYYVLQIE